MMEYIVIFLIAVSCLCTFSPVKREKLNDEFEIVTEQSSEFGGGLFATIYRNGKPCGSKHLIFCGTAETIISKKISENKCLVVYGNGQTQELIITGNTITVNDWDMDKYRSEK